MELEKNLGETSRELDVLRESLNEAELRANTDSLTGLPNRRAFDEFLRTSHHAAMENGEPFSVLLIDIDQFSNSTSSRGTGRGSVVAADGECAAGTFERKDRPARYGGEEFIAVLPGAELAACEATAERIRKSVSECRITRRSTGDILPGITVSIGAAQFRPGESRLNWSNGATVRSLWRSGSDETGS